MDGDRGAMKFLRLFIRTCVSFDSIGTLRFFFTETLSQDAGEPEPEVGSMLTTLMDDAKGVSTGLASPAKKPLVSALCMLGCVSIDIRFAFASVVLTVNEVSSFFVESR